MANKIRSKLGYLDTKSTLFLLCDLQERFRTESTHFAAIVENTQKILKCGEKLNIDLIVSEQNPEKLGPTAKELDISHAMGKVYPKLEFSMMANPVIRESIMATEDIRSIVIFGLEAHACIEQTTMDLLDENFDVHILADCTSSRSQEDRQLAFDRLKQIGGFVTTSENVILKLIRGKNHPEFPAILDLIRQPSKNTGLI